jgi:hypothetical protein
MHQKLLLIILTAGTTAIIVGGSVYLFLSNQPSFRSDGQNKVLSVPEKSIEPSQSPTTTQQANKDSTIITEQWGYIRSIYSKNGKTYIDFDDVEECIQDPEEAARAVLEDGKCPPGVTFEKLMEAYEEGRGNFAIVCPRVGFGLGSGYCYFRNRDARVKTLEVYPDAVVFLPRHPYASEEDYEYFKKEYPNLCIWKDGRFVVSLDYLKNPEFPVPEYLKNPLNGVPFKIVSVNNMVMIIQKILVPAE